MTKVRKLISGEVVYGSGEVATLSLINEKTKTGLIKLKNNNIFWTSLHNLKNTKKED